jgi:hypothetical protein
VPAIEHDRVAGVTSRRAIASNSAILVTARWPFALPFSFGHGDLCQGDATLATSLRVCVEIIPTINGIGLINHNRGRQKSTSPANKAQMALTAAATARQRTKYKVTTNIAIQAQPSQIEIVSALPSGT